jgi:glycosyltransferase involved in cell wall biosynthesis
MTKKNRIEKKKSSVSLITVNQLVRHQCLLNLYELIKLQTYKNIIEWVIVEGSKNYDDSVINKNLITNFINEHKLSPYNYINIIYLEYNKTDALSDLRNRGNNACSGDIIVCMDDDDYYPSDRVSHAVESLDKSSCLIAGCSDIYMYEYFMGKLYKFKGFHQKHSTNNCMAFKREYLKNHKHDSGLIMSEEKSFTNDFTEPMVQLISKKCIIVSSHDFNTFNKRELCIGGTIGVNPSLYEVTDHPITNYIPPDIFKRMKSIFYKEAESPYDIVYYTGGLGSVWDPTDKTLGGSEQAIVNLCECWVKMGKKVAVYADILSNRKTEIIHNGVEYKNWKTLEFNHKFKIIILWRTYGLFSGIPFDLNAEKIYWDVHDNFMNQDNLINIYNKYKHKITKILFKSEFHKLEFEKYMKNKLKSEQYVIIPNGIKKEEFSNNWDNVKRNDYRFCYVSYYTRGLDIILKFIWPTIKTLEPRAELHLYYGLDMFKDDKLVEYYKTLIGMSKGVIDHGRQSTNIIVREKYLSRFQLYITNTGSEIDCISIRESLVTGCIPLISNYGVFKEREGIHFDLPDTSHEELIKKIGEQIVNLWNNKPQLEHFANLFSKSNTILSWNDISLKIYNI